MTRSKGIALLLTALGALGLVATTLGRAIFQGQTPGLGSFAAIHFVGFLFLSPLSSPNTLLAAGIRRYHPVKAFLYSTAGLTVKYAGILYLFDATSVFFGAGP